MADYFAYCGDIEVVGSCSSQPPPPAKETTKKRRKELMNFGQKKGTTTTKKPNHLSNKNSLETLSLCWGFLF